MSRTLIALALAASTPAFASFDFDGRCVDLLTTSDRSSFEFSEDWLDANAFEVVDHVRRVRAGGNPYDYNSFDTADYTEWETEIDELLRGDINVKCRYDADPGPCTDSTLMGQTIGDPIFGEVFDGITICVDNIRAFASGSDASDGFRALLTGVIAHEVMHHADGFEGHGPSGDTDPAHPDTSAEVIGSAVEHMVAVPELDPSLSRTSVTMTGAGRHRLTLSGSVRNESTTSLYNQTPASNYDLNPVTNTCVRVDGSTVQTYNTGDLDDSTSSTSTLTVEVSAYNPSAPIREISLFADCDRELFELDEDDNTAVYEHSTWVDLDLDVELDAAPVKKLNLGPYGPTWYYDLTFRATITNLDGDTPAPATDLQVGTTDLFSSAPRSGIVSLAVPALNPGASTSITFTAQVAASALGTLPTGTSYANVFLDAGTYDMHDRDTTNNVWALTINSAWWKPDYRLVDVQFTGNTTAPMVPGFGLFQIGTVKTGLSFAVENRGPAAASASSWLTIHGSAGTELGRYQVSALASMGKSPTSRAVLATVLCNEADYELRADGRSQITENDETNNVAAISIGADCDLSVPDLAPMVDLGMFDEILYGQLELDPMIDLITWQDTQDWIDEMFDRSVVGPFLPTDWEEDYIHVFVVEDQLVGLISTPDAKGVRSMMNSPLLQSTWQAQTVNRALWLPSQTIRIQPRFNF